MAPDGTSQRSDAVPVAFAWTATEPLTLFAYVLPLPSAEARSSPETIVGCAPLPGTQRNALPFHVPLFAFAMVAGVVDAEADPATANAASVAPTAPTKMESWNRVFVIVILFHSIEFALWLLTNLYVISRPYLLCGVGTLMSLCPSEWSW